MNLDSNAVIKLSRILKFTKLQSVRGRVIGLGLICCCSYSLIITKYAILTWKLFVISGSWLYYLCWLLSIFPGHLLHTCTSHWNKNMKNLKPWAWDLVLSKEQKQILKFSSYQCLFYLSFMDNKWCHWLIFWVSIHSVANDRGPRAEILKYNVNFEPNLGPRLFATLSIEFH